MSLIDIVLKQRPKSASKSYRPTMEMLEERQCMSVSVPTGVALTALSPTQVKVTWSNQPSELGFNVFRWDGTKSILAGSVAKDVTQLTVGALPPNQTQWFSVTAFDLTTSAQSAWASIMTPADAITAPTNLRVASATQTQINLVWNNSTGTLGYRVYGWDGAHAVLLGSTTPAVPAFNVKNLAPGIVYYFYVEAFNNTNSAATDWLTASTASSGITTPTNVKTTVLGASSIALSWNDVAGETGYRVFAWNGNAGSTATVIANLAANTTGYQAVGLLPGRTYSFYVQAFNATNFANSVWVSAMTAVALPLQPPTQLVVQITGPNSVNVSWTEPARAVGYRVAVWTGIDWAVVATVPAGTHTVPITGLLSNQTQWFMVQSFTTNNAEVAYSGAVFVNL